jgi:hypothetical protein
MFIHRRDTDKHIVLTIDVHKYHISGDLLDGGNESKIILIVPHHILQPLYDGCFCHHNIDSVRHSWAQLHLQLQDMTLIC